MKIKKTSKKIIALKKSFTHKYGPKGILSSVLYNPNGFVEPCECKAIKCNKIKKAKTKGNK